MRDLIQVGREIDFVIINNLEKEMSIKNLVGILAHRLGTLLATQPIDTKIAYLRMVNRIIRGRTDIL